MPSSSSKKRPQPEKRLSFRETMSARRVVVTGLGMVTPLGCGVDITWARMLEGRSGARRIQKFPTDDLPCKIAADVARGDGSDGTFEINRWVDSKEHRRVDDFIIFALTTAPHPFDDSTPN